MSIVKTGFYSPAWFEKPEIVEKILTKLASHSSFKSIIQGRDAFAAAEPERPIEDVNQASVCAGLERLAEILDSYTELQGDLEELSGVRRYGDSEWCRTFVWALGRPTDEKGDILIEEDNASPPRPSSFPPPAAEVLS